MESEAHKSSLVNRQGEHGPVPPRRKRVLIKNKQWYFITRNGLEHGPYQNMTEAKKELALFLRRSGVVRFTI